MNEQQQNRFVTVCVRLAPWWVVLYTACLVKTGAAEAALGLGVALALACWAVGRRTALMLPGKAVWQGIGAVFLAYWGAELLSAPDALVPAKAWKEVALDVRYLPALWLAAVAVREAHGRRIVYAGIAVVTAWWTLDAVAQGLTGTSPTLWLAKLVSPSIEARQLYPDRMQGLFGATNFTLGQTLASLTPFLLFWLRGRVLWLPATAALCFVILLTGTRAAWVTLALVLLCELWLMRTVWLRLRGKKLAALLVGIVVALSAVGWSAWQHDGFKGRVQQTMGLFSKNVQAQDWALSGRATLWSSGTERMLRDHWLNGVGVRSFRDAYPQYAGKEYAGQGDLFTQGGGTAMHAHQIVLELLSETGLVGLALWLAAAGWLIRLWWRASDAIRARASPATLAAVVTFFPLNTHLAFFSSYWGSLSLMLIGLTIGGLASTEPSPQPHRLRDCRRILIIKHGAFGDLVQSFGTLADIRAELPQAELTLLTAPAYRNLMARCPHIDRVLTDARPHWRHWRENRALLKQLAAERFDAVIDLQHSARVRHYRRLAFQNALWIGAASTPVPSMLEGFRQQLLAAGITVRHAPQPDAHWMAADMDGFLARHRVPERFIFLIPGCSAAHPEKRWPYYAALAAVLRARGFAVVTAPGLDELAWAHTLGGHVLLHENGAILDWFELAGVLRRAAFVVGNDTGPSHLAAALGLRGLALFGPATSATRTAIAREGRFAALEAPDLAKLPVDAVFQRILDGLDPADLLHT